MKRESYLESGLKVAFVSGDPLGKGKNRGSSLALGKELKRRIHEVIDWLHLMGDFVKQSGRVREWAVVGCVERIVEWFLEVDDEEMQEMTGQEKLGWSCRFLS
jgi:hypothetical protein